MAPMLSPIPLARIISSGEVAEWLNAPHSKCGIPARVSGVRIPPSPPLSYRKLQNLCLRARNSFCVQRGLRDGTEPWRPTGRWPPVSEWASVSFCTNLDVCGSGENSLFFQHVAKSGRLYVSDPHSALQSSLRTRGSRSRARSRVVQSRIRLPPPWLRQRRASFARPMAGRRFRSGH